MSDAMHEVISSNQMIFSGILIVLCVLLFLCLIRACIGPTVGDRLVSVNMMGTIVMVIIGMLAIMMNEGYLVDISMLYAMLSFLAVILLTKVIIGVHNETNVQDSTEQDTENKAKEGN